MVYNWKRRRRIITVLTVFILSFVVFTLFPVGSDTAWCEDTPECPFIYASQCQCESTLEGVKCYIIPCGDTNNDGCYELDFDNKYKCSYRCEQIGTYEAECTYKPSPCKSECEIGESWCVGSPPSYEYDGHSVQKCVDENKDGCGERQDSLESCSPLGCLQKGKNAYCKYVEPECDHSCLAGQSKCLYIGGQNYRDTCGDYDDDTCREFYSEVNPEQLGLDMEYCPFGCEEPQFHHAVCKIEPEVCKSTCKDGDKMCGGDGYDIFECVYNSADNCWQYFDENGNAVNVEHCDYGCEEIIENQAECKSENVEPLEPIVNKTALLLYHFDKGSGDYAYSSGTLNVTLNLASEKSGSCIWDKNSKYGAYTINTTNTSCDMKSIESIAGIPAGTVETWIKIMNTTVVEDSFLFYHYPVALGNPDIKFMIRSSITGNGDLRCRINGSASAQVTYSNFLSKVIPGDWNKLSCSWGEKGMFIYMNHEVVAFDISVNGTYDKGENFGQFNFPGADSDLNFFIDEWALYDYQKNYSAGIKQNKCRLGSKKCLGDMYIDGRWIKPYLVYCSDIDGDGYYEYPESINELGNSVGDSCPYGCHYNETIGNVECRASTPANCTEKDWECIPGVKQCNRYTNWMEECEAPNGDNCYTWVQKTFCFPGCNPSGTGCKQCLDECSSGESKCLNEGFKGIDPRHEQSVWYDTPIVVNCTYNYNLGCWNWDLWESERCVYGCYENFSYITNTSRGYCRTKETFDEYYLGNFTDSIKDSMSYFSNILIIALPENLRYMFFFIISLFATGLITFKTGHWKLGILILVLFILFGGLIGWLPIWTTVVLVIVSGLFLMKKLFWGNE